MTKISVYSVDQNIGGNDKWIGSDAQNNQATKNFTPSRLADYFNNNNVIDIGLSIRYRYQTLDPGEDREQGTISFETEVGPQVNFSAISSFLLAKNTLKQNDVSQYLELLIGATVVISKASNVNTYGYYTISSIDPYIPDPNFFVVTLEFISGNGFIYEDLDYLISLVDKSSSSGGAVWGSITGVLADQTDLITYLGNTYVPYTGATASLNIGEFSFNAADAGANSSSLYGSSLDFYGAGGEYNTFGVTGLYLSLGSAYLSLTPGSIDLNGAVISYAGTSDSFILPDKSGLGGTFAMLSDIPAALDLQGVTDIGKETTNDLITKSTGVLGPFYRSTLSKDGLYILRGSNYSILFNGATVYDSKLEFNSGDGISATIGMQSGFPGRATDFKLPYKTTGTYILATTSDIIPTTWGSITGTITDQTDLITYLSTNYVPYTGATSNVNLGTYGLLSEYLEVNTSPTTYTPGVGRFGWNDTDGTIEFKLKGGNVTLQIGQEQVIRVVNKTTPLINLLEANYQVCLITGATGQRVSVRLAQGDTDANSAGTLGVVTENINANQEGFITTNGSVKEINTTGSLQGETWADGDILYLSPTTAGAMTNIKPTAPNHTVIVGYVEYAHAVHGKIYVKIDNGYELGELHNVNTTISKTTPVDADNLLLEDSAGSLVWKKLSWANLKATAYLDATSSIQGQLDGKQGLIDNMFMNQLPNTAYGSLTSYVVAVTNTAFSSNAANSNNTTRFVPFVLDKAVSFDAFYIFQTTANAGAGGYMTMYIYDDSNNGLPGIILHQESLAAGSMNTTSGVHTFNSNVTLQPGVYWMAFHIRNLDTAGVNPTFYFTQNSNNKTIEFGVPTHGNNQYYFIRVAATVGDLGNNPVLTTATTSVPQTMMVKYKTQ